MKHSLLRLSILALLLAIKVAAFGKVEFEVEGLHYSVTSESDLTVDVISAGWKERDAIDGDNLLGYYAKDIVIPETVKYNGSIYTVTGIADEAFKYCSYLSTITIPSTVIKIGKDAFQDCYRLSSIDLGKSIKTIGNGAFYNCRNLPSITFPNSLVEIGSNAFINCYRLESVIIPNSVEKIGTEAFSFCKNLKYASIPGSLKKIERGLFEHCTNLRAVDIKDGVKEIGQSAFSECNELDSIVIPNSVVSMGSGVFKNCINLKSVVLPQNITKISNWMFNNCKRLEKCNIPNDVSAIETHAFDGCRNLKNLTVPKSVSSIDVSAFYECENLTLKLESSEPLNLERDIYVYSLEVPKGATVKYAKANYWKDAEYIYANENGVKYFPSFLVSEDGTNAVVMEDGIENGIEVAENQQIIVKPSDNPNITRYVLKGSIDVSDTLAINGYYSFYPISNYRENIVYTYSFDVKTFSLSTSGTLIDLVGVENVENINAIKIIGDVNGTDIMTIRKMTNLQYLDLADARIVNGGMSYYQTYVTSENTIGDYFFKDKVSFIKIILPNTIEYINNYSFDHCENIRSIKIPKTVKDMQQYAFYQCRNLKSAVILCPNANFGSFRSIRCAVVGEEVETIDLGCEDLISFNIPHSVKKIIMFSSCHIRSLKIPNTVTYVGGINCIRLTNLELPNQLDKLPRFIACRNLESLVIPNNVKEIEWENFLNCANLQSIVIPNGLTTINDRAFDGCSSLQSISLPNSITHIGSGVFNKCHDLQSIEIPDGVKKIYGFGECKRLYSVKYGSLESIGDFQYCTSLESFTFSQSLTAIRGFSNSGLKSIHIPSNINTINYGAFSECLDLTEVVIEDSQNSIEFKDSYVFSFSSVESLYLGRNLFCKDKDYSTYKSKNMYNLKQIVIGKNVTSLGREVFYGYQVQNNVTSLNPTPPVIEENTFDDYTYNNATLYVPKGSKTLYWLHPYWEKFEHIEELEEDVSDIKQTSIANKSSDSIYNLNGTKVDDNSLGKGIYIKNGKKVIIK